MRAEGAARALDGTRPRGHRTTESRAAPGRQEPGSWGGVGPACPEQWWEKVGPCTPVSYSASSGQDPPGRTLAPSRGSCSRRPDRPLTRPCCHSGRHRYISSGQRQGPDNEMPTTAWLCHRLQTESEIRGVLGQWKPEARLTADNREASRKQGLPSGSITKSLAPF